MRRSEVVEAESTTSQFLARGGSPDTFVIAKASTQKEDWAIVAQACFFTSLLSVSSICMCGVAIHWQARGVVSTSCTCSAKIKTAKISPNFAPAKISCYIQ